jgi:Zn-dependent protease with chaperone function
MLKLRNELRAFIKNSLRARMLLYEALALSLALFISAIPFYFMKITVLGVFWVVSLITFPLLATSLKSQFKLVFAKKYEADQATKETVYRTAERMHVRKPKKILIAQGVLNAYVRFQTLVLGDLLLKTLSTANLECVIAHELAHQKRHHAIKMICATTAFLAFPLLVWQRAYYVPIIFNEQFTSIMLSVMICIGTLALISALMIPLNYFLEFDADGIATKAMGKARMIAAYLAIAKKEDFRESSESHPSILDRIKRILRMNDAPV